MEPTLLGLTWADGAIEYFYRHGDDSAHVNDFVKRGWRSSSVGGVKRKDAKEAKKAKNEGGAVWAGVQVRGAG